MSTTAVVLRVAHEGLTAFESLLDFDEKSIKALQTACKEKVPAIAADPDDGIVAQQEISGVSIPSKCILRLIEAIHCAQYYKSIGRSLSSESLHYDNVLMAFKTERKAYEAMKDDQTEPKVPMLSDKDGDLKVINWIPAFQDHCMMCFGALGPLAYIICEKLEVPPEAEDPLDNTSYYGKSGSLIQELVERVPHSGPIYRADNNRVFMKISEAVKGTSCESTVKAFARTKDGRAAYLALISNHAGEVKYRALLKSSMHYLQNVKWNGYQFPVEAHVSKHRKAHQIVECSAHISCPTITSEQKVEYLLDSISCNDNTIQATLALIRSNPTLRGDFEQAASNIIEVDPHRKLKAVTTGKRPAYNISDSSMISYGAGRGQSGVDLRWHSKKEFSSLSPDQKDELTKWMKTKEGKQVRAAAKAKNKEAHNKRAKNSKRAKYQKQVESNLRDVFSVLLAEKPSVGSTTSTNLTASNLASAVATTTDLQSILKNGSSVFKKTE